MNDPRPLERIRCVESVAAVGFLLPITDTLETDQHECTQHTSG